jgi:hypothetical protein
MGYIKRLWSQAWEVVICAGQLLKSKVLRTDESSIWHALDSAARQAVSLPWRVVAGERPQRASLGKASEFTTQR